VHFTNKIDIGVVDKANVRRQWDSFSDRDLVYCNSICHENINFHFGYN